MFRFIKIMFEMALPIFITFHFLPKIWNVIFGEEEDEKPKLRQMGSHRNPPPPPKPRKVGSTLIEEHRILQKQLEQYEVRGGRIVKKDPRPKLEPEYDKPKKKHFTKGVDPDFL